MKKSQLQMGESVAVLFIFFILIAFGFSFYMNIMKGSQKIAKYLMNNKVPKENRTNSPVVISNGKIIWLAGFVIDDSVKVTSGTRKILKAELFLA